MGERGGKARVVSSREVMGTYEHSAEELALLEKYGHLFQPRKDFPMETHYATNYETVVSDPVRSHTASLMQSWIDDGRPDDRIDDLVKSLVLNAYASGRKDALVDASGAVEALR